MKFLLDTHILLWAAAAPEKLSGSFRELLADEANQLYFSAASLWEIAIKCSLGREDFQGDVHVFRRALLDNGYLELPIDSRHAVNTCVLPAIHKDPFDRMLVSQAISEGMKLLTADAKIALYSGPILKM
mgnify:CR=1 FL=1